MRVGKRISDAPAIDKYDQSRLFAMRKELTLKKERRAKVWESEGAIWDESVDRELSSVESRRLRKGSRELKV